MFDKNQDSIANLEAKLEILGKNLISDLDDAIDKIKAEHAAKGRLKSGATIKRVMREIQDTVSRWYQYQVEHFQKLPFEYSKGLESSIFDLTNGKTEKIVKNAFSRLADVTKLIGQDGLYNRVVGDVQTEFDQSKERFENEISAIVIGLKNKQKLSKGDKASLAMEKGNIMATASLSGKTTWDEIQKEYDISKRAFGKRINFVTDMFKRKIIFRDIEHSYILANYGYSKPAVILAGSVIEELLRLYLNYKGIKPTKKNFNSYIQACENNGLLKTGISRLSDSVRHFRNIVHLEKEISSQTTIKKVTAKGAVTSIFTIANDF